MFAIANQLEQQRFFSKDEFLSAAVNANFVFSVLRDNVESLEGYLYPKTYTVTEEMSAKDLARVMVQNFLECMKGCLILNLI